MSRSPRVLAFTFLAAAIVVTPAPRAGALAAPLEAAPPPAATDCGPDDPCPAEPVEGRLVEIQVDGDARAKPSCVRIKKGNTVVVWAGTPDVARLGITFKNPPAGGPKDPACSGATCTLEKAKQGTQHGEFAYLIRIERRDGTVVVCDPKLILNP